MQNLRSALNRVTREKKIPVVTSSEDKYLYVWRADASKSAGTNEYHAKAVAPVGRATKKLSCGCGSSSRAFFKLLLS